MKFTQADWEQHVANNHVPYRRDCAVCVHGAGNGRRRHGVVHPEVYCMSADIAGPIRVKGKDPESRNHRPATFKYFLAASYRFPRLKGVKEESDPSQTEGFDDAALLPRETHDLADEAFPVAEGPLREDSLYEPSLEEEESEDEGVEGPREFAAKVAEEHPWESARCELETPPDMATLVFAVPLHTNKGDSLEEELTPPPRRVRGKRSAGVRLDDVFALDPQPPLPPPAEAPHPEGPVSPVEEESARVARLSLQDLEGLATELIEDDWDLDEALWVLAEVCRAVVHTVDPGDAEQCIEKWMPSIHKEIGVIEKAVRRLPPAEGDAALATRKGQAYHKRKARLVACGNHAYSETQAVGTGTVAQQDLQLSAFAVLLAVFQVVGAASQTTDEEEDLSLPVSLDADLMLAVSIICSGICFIAVWEFFKWCLQGVISRREAGTPVLSLSPRKARKLQRLRDQTAQAIHAEISAREEAASSQSVAAAPSLLSFKRASSATGVLQTTPSTAQGALKALA
ncbi:GIP [Symbiodinium sp. CCMP2592]|nr:GIP [Symbiodinium sp. CCMP2592]